MKILITGVSGFTGHHLLSYLLSQRDGVTHVFGLSRSRSNLSLPGYSSIIGDLSRKDEMNRIIQQISPDAIIHLAGQNRGCLGDLLQMNVINTEHLLEAVRLHLPHTRILVVGSSAEYGYDGKDPMDEETPFRPVGAYGISKVAEELLAFQYRHVYGLNITVARPFNLIGPGQPDTFVCGKLALQAAEIKSGIRGRFELAGGDARRDYIDVRDVVDAYWRLISHPSFKDRIAGYAFNIGSEKCYSVTEVIEEMIQIIHSSSPIPSFTSESELIPMQIADTTRLRKETGWKPSLSFHQSLRDMIDQIR